MNIIENFNLDIAVIDRNLNVSDTILIENKAGENTGIDVFFVHPTQLTTIPLQPTTVPIDEQPSSIITGTILAQGGLLAKYGRVFAPKYRQASPSSFLSSTYSESDKATALLEAYSDIKSAFYHYLNEHNNGNRIILAGHSQGSFLLAMLLRDVFDSDIALRGRLVTAVLAGMNFVYASPQELQGGWWENIPICSTVDECGCIQRWVSFKEDQSVPEANSALPCFNSVLVDSNVVYRTLDLNQDVILMDSLYYNEQSQPLRYYIAPDASYNLSNGFNFIAFDSLFTVKHKRVSPTKVVLAIDYTDFPGDQRPNDLLAQEDHPNYDFWGFHVKDYHIYLWALMEQIDVKISKCQLTTSVDITPKNDSFIVYPNPGFGSFYIMPSNALAHQSEEVYIYDLFGRVIKSLNVDARGVMVSMSQKGTYWLISSKGRQCIIVQ